MNALILFFARHFNNLSRLNWTELHSQLLTADGYQCGVLAPNFSRSRRDAAGEGTKGENGEIRERRRTKRGERGTGEVEVEVAHGVCRHARTRLDGGERAAP